MIDRFGLINLNEQTREKKPGHDLNLMATTRRVGVVSERRGACPFCSAAHEKERKRPRGQGRGEAMERAVWQRPVPSGRFTCLCLVSSGRKLLFFQPHPCLVVISSPIHCVRTPRKFHFLQGQQPIITCSCSASK